MRTRKAKPGKICPDDMSGQGFQALAHESGFRAEKALQQYHGKKELVSPYLVRLKRDGIEPHQATLM
jgi:hypothetical protein